MPKMRFLAGAARLQRRCRVITFAGIRGDMAGFVLNAPLSSVICR
jgi:hypothetical protein